MIATVSPCPMTDDPYFPETELFVDEEPSVVVVEGVDKTYHLGNVEVTGLDEVSVRIPRNRFTVLSGPSGSGKTTLLNLLGCIDRPDAGRIVIDGTDVATLSDDALSDFRARNIGYVFQTFNLIPVLTAYENIEYPLRLTEMPADKRARRVSKLLSAVGLEDKAKHKPNELSGGQRQRVAVARALVTKPRLVLADEPTANLDSRTGTEILRLMRRMQRQSGVSFVFSSHDPRVLRAADVIIRIRDGRVLPPEAPLTPPPKDRL
jgi:putative ABC transport system ATP-binding protein